MIKVTERGYRESCLGQVLQIKVFADDYRPLLWGEVWQEFTRRYPQQWAVQVFPPEDQVVDSKAVYHLFVCDASLEGLNLRS